MLLVAFFTLFQISVLAQDSIKVPAKTASAGEPLKDSLMLNQKYYLLLQGNVMQSKATDKGKVKLLDSVMIRVLNETDFVLATRYSKKGNCEIKLPLNKKFTIEFSKRGYVSKIIAINTGVPKYEMFINVFPFDIDLFEEIAGLDVEVLREPIAKITYNNFNKTFDYDYNYTVKINNNIKKLYNEYYRLQKAQKERLEKK